MKKTIARAARWLGVQTTKLLAESMAKHINWSCPALTDTFPFGSTREVNHGGKKARAVFARVQGADDRACEGWT